MKKILLIALTTVVLLAVIGASLDHPKTKAAKAAKANVVVTGGHCFAAPSEAVIGTEVDVRNLGGASAEVTPWAAYRYSDGGHSSEPYQSTLNGETSVTLPAHSRVFVLTFVHTYNPQQHEPIGCDGFHHHGAPPGAPSLRVVARFLKPAKLVAAPSAASSALRRR